jgi:hypothetical protein
MSWFYANNSWQSLRHGTWPVDICLESLKIPIQDRHQVTRSNPPANFIHGTPELWTGALTYMIRLSYLAQQQQRVSYVHLGENTMFSYFSPCSNWYFFFGIVNPPVITALASSSIDAIASKVCEHWAHMRLFVPLWLLALHPPNYPRNRL